MYHIVCVGEERIPDVIRRMDIFSNSKPEAEGLALIIKSLFPDVMAILVGYEYLPFEINREFSVIVDCKNESATVEFGEFDSSDLERIRGYRSSYMNAGLVWKPWKDVLVGIRKGLLGRVLQRIARGITVYCVEVVLRTFGVPVVAVHSDASAGINGDLSHVRVPLRRRMRVRHIECEKRKLFGGNLLQVTPCILEHRDRDLDVLMNYLPVEEHYFDIDNGLRNLYVERLVAKVRFYRLGNNTRMQLNGVGGNELLRWWRCIT
jgi:hypothetical protein